jgi:hypothetical protein
MHGFKRSVVLVALLLAAALGAAPASAGQQPAPAPLRGALAPLTSPGASLARLWAWVENHLPGRGLDVAPAATRRPAGVPGSAVHPDDGSAPDPNGG